MKGTISAIIVTVSMLVAGPASAQPAGGDVDVTIEPGTVDVVLGEAFDLIVSVTNRSSATSAPLVAHLDITDPAESTSVDPEDWTATLSKSVGELAPGETAQVGWDLQPISPGTFAVYSVALSGGSQEVFVSGALLVSVDDRRSLNPEGILPVAVGAPAAVGGLLVAQILRRRRGAGG